jgi:hypothetical protein
MRKQDIFVKVYPAGCDKDGNYTNPVKVILAQVPENDEIAYNNAREFRDRYVRDEYKFCRVEEDAYNAAVFRNDRIRCKNNLMLKRADFAKMKGYFGPDDRWTKVEISLVESTL